MDIPYSNYWYFNFDNGASSYNFLFAANGLNNLMVFLSVYSGKTGYGLSFVDAVASYSAYQANTWSQFNLMG